MNLHQMPYSLKNIENTLAGLPLGDIRFYPSTASTNSDALEWSAHGAPDFSLVVADTQTHGRGRLARRWFTPAGSALACSFVFRPSAFEQPNLPLFTALGALAVCHLADQFCNVPARIKWPNDVLLEDKKTAGILAEMVWEGDQFSALVLGIGINLFPASVPDRNAVLFPATCMQVYTLQPIDRLQALRALIEGLLKFRPLLRDKSAFMHAWQSRLAYIGEYITISAAGSPLIDGIFMGVDECGSVLLKDTNGIVTTHQAGDLSLRLKNSNTI